MSLITFKSAVQSPQHVDVMSPASAYARGPAREARSHQPLPSTRPKISEAAQKLLPLAEHMVNPPSAYRAKLNAENNLTANGRHRTALQHATSLTPAEVKASALEYYWDAKLIESSSQTLGVNPNALRSRLFGEVAWDAYMPITSFK